MDMMYNFGCAEHDSKDWLGPDTGCRGSAKAAVDGWPSSVKQIYTPVGADVLHGNWLTGCAAFGNPCRQVTPICECELIDPFCRPLKIGWAPALEDLVGIPLLS